MDATQYTQLIEHLQALGQLTGSVLVWLQVLVFVCLALVFLGFQRR